MQDAGEYMAFHLRQTDNSEALQMQGLPPDIYDFEHMMDMAAEVQEKHPSIRTIYIAADRFDGACAGLPKCAYPTASQCRLQTPCELAHKLKPCRAVSCPVVSCRGEPGKVCRVYEKNWTFVYNKKVSKDDGGSGWRASVGPAFAL